MTLTDASEIDFQLRLADTNLDTVLVQAEHLSRSVRLAAFVPEIQQQTTHCFRLSSDYSSIPNTKTTIEIVVLETNTVDK